MTQHVADKPLPPAENKKPRRDRVTFFNSLYADTAGVVLSAISSIGAATLMIDKNFFKNAEKEKRFDKYHKIRDSQRASPETTKLKNHDWLIRIREIEKEHESSIAKELRGMGITGPIEKFRSLRAHQKQEVVFTAAAVAAGAIGVISTIIGNRLTAQKEQQLSDKLDELAEKQSDSNAPSRV